MRLTPSTKASRLATGTAAGAIAAQREVSTRVSTDAGSWSSESWMEASYSGAHGSSLSTYDPGFVTWPQCIPEPRSARSDRMATNGPPLERRAHESVGTGRGSGPVSGVRSHDETSRPGGHALRRASRSPDDHQRARAVAGPVAGRGGSGRAGLAAGGRGRDRRSGREPQPSPGAGSAGGDRAARGPLPRGHSGARTKRGHGAARGGRAGARARITAARAARGEAARFGPSQRRVPRHPRARAAQPPGSDPQRARDHAAGRARQRRGRASAGADRAAARPGGAVDRRPARRQPASASAASSCAETTSSSRRWCRTPSRERGP